MYETFICLASVKRKWCGSLVVFCLGAGSLGSQEGFVSGAIGGCFAFPSYPPPDRHISRPRAELTEKPACRLSAFGITALNFVSNTRSMP